MFRSGASSFRKGIYVSALWLKALVLVITGVLPAVLFSSPVSAAQLPSRSLTLSTSQISTAATNTFAFNIGTTGNVGSMQFEYCTTPLGTCTAPTGLSASSATLTSATISGSAGAFTLGTNTSNRTRITRTPVSASSGAAASVVFGNITNPSTVNSTFYVRITTFSDNAYTTAVDTGVVAAAAAERLTVSARVQERLDFCVGSTTVDDATTSPGAACANITGNTVDIGIIDSGTINYSPVSTTNGGNATNGVAMVRTNAVNGVVVSYFAEQNTSSGKLKVAGATCSGTSTTDQCFNSSSTQSTLVAGTEEFGMTVAGVNCGSASAYTCTFSSGAYNLARDTAYDGTGSNTYNTGSGNGYAWQDNGTTTAIASSASSSVKVVDDEALILKFAATAGITTPTGQYTVTSTYIATATF